jgi:outer membrane lipoprotein carrier protein
MKTIRIRFIDLHLFLTVFLLVITPSLPVLAQTPEALAEQIRTTYAEIGSISFSFSQTTGGQVAGRPRTGKGTALFAKDRGKHLMRWNYLLPDPQVVISDGTTVSMYFEKLNQMIITDVDTAHTDTLFSFFTATEPLSSHFAVLPADPETAADSGAGLQVLQLQPLDSDTQIKSIHLWTDSRSIIRRIDLLDYFDTHTTINLSNIEINPLDLTDEQDLSARFSFVPPDGTEIIRQ